MNGVYFVIRIHCSQVRRLLDLSSRIQPTCFAHSALMAEMRILSIQDDKGQGLMVNKPFRHQLGVHFTYNIDHMIKICHGIEVFQRNLIKQPQTYIQSGYALYPSSSMSCSAMNSPSTYKSSSLICSILRRQVFTKESWQR